MKNLGVHFNLVPGKGDPRVARGVRLRAQWRTQWRTPVK